MAKELLAKVEAELARLGVDLSVCAEANLPLGWVRVSDGTGELPGGAYGEASAVAEALAAVPATGEVAEDWEAAWEALGECDYRGPKSVREWPDGLVSTEPLEEGTCNDEPNTLVTVETNAGTRYAAGPHGVGTDALSEWIDNGYELKKTRTEAVEECTSLDS